MLPHAIGTLPQHATIQRKRIKEFRATWESKDLEKELKTYVSPYDLRNSKYELSWESDKDLGITCEIYLRGFT